MRVVAERHRAACVATAGHFKLTSARYTLRHRIISTTTAGVEEEEVEVSVNATFSDIYISYLNGRMTEYLTNVAIIIIIKKGGRAS